MDWQKVYKKLDYLSEIAYVSNVYISYTLTVIIVFNMWDHVSQRYLNLDRYCYMFTDGAIGYGQ